MNTKNICRPITLFNKQVPATSDHLSCDYLAFGDYEGVSIGENLLKTEERKDFSHLWTTLINESQELKGEYISRTLFAFRSEEETGPEVRDQTFYQYQELPFLFVTLLQYSEYKIDRNFLKRRIERKINRSWEENQARAITYVTLDKSDIILILKTKSYDFGWKIINDLHSSNNTRKETRGRNYSLRLNYSFTIPAFSLEVLNNPETDFSKYDSFIEKVTFSSIEKEPGSIIGLLEKLKAVGGNDIKDTSHLGNDDVIISWERLSWKQLLPLYKRRSEQTDSPLEGILIDEHPDYLNCVHSIVTSVYPDHTERKPDLQLFNEMDVQSLTGQTLELSLTGSCSYYREKVQNYMRCGCKSGYLPEQNARLTYGKTLLQILNALEKFERTDFPKYAFVSIFEPLKQFIDLLDKEKEEEEYNHITEQEFLNAINILVQNTDTVDRQFFQAPEFNAGIYNVPAKLEAFYSAYIYNVTKLYNSLKQGDVKHTYKFLLCPWIEKQTNSTLIFPKSQPQNRVILIKIPERFLYAPETLMIILGHEVGHFVGGPTRKRELRRTVTEKIVIIGIVAYLKEQTKAGEYMSEETIKRCIRFLNDKVLDFSMHYQNMHPEQKEYFDHSSYVKQYLYNTFNDIVLIYFNDMWNLIRENYLRETAKENNFENCPDYQEYKKFIAENKKNLERLPKSAREMEQVWNQSLLELTVKNGYKINENVDTIMDILIEGYADLTGILALDLSPEKYLNSFLEIVDDVNTSAIVIRMCLVAKTMRLMPGDPETSSFCWQESWNKLYGSRNRYHGEMAELIKKMTEIMGQIEKPDCEKIEFLAPGADVRLDFYLFEYSKVWKYMENYLYQCKVEIEQFLKGQESRKWKEQLKKTYEEMCRFNSVEKTIAMIDDIIAEYTEHVYSKTMPYEEAGGQAFQA